MLSNNSSRFFFQLSPSVTVRYVVVTKAFVYYLLPLFIIGVLYLMMAQRLHVSAREMPGESLSMQSRSQIRARRYVARMVVAFVVGEYKFQFIVQKYTDKAIYS